MSYWPYDDSKPKRLGDKKKLKANYDKIFGKPCDECGMRGGQHKSSCTNTDGRSN